VCWRRGGGFHTGFWWGNLKERENLENLGVDGEIILTRILKRSVRRAWTVLAQVRDKWRAVVNYGACNYSAALTVAQIMPDDW
jgi:hypothetical protein